MSSCQLLLPPALSAKVEYDTNLLLNLQLFINFQTPPMEDSIIAVLPG